MKSRALLPSALACAVICSWSTRSGAQNQAIYVPYAAGTAPRPVQVTHPPAHAIPPTSAFWTRANNAPPDSVGAILLLTDGRVLLQSASNESNWYTLTPDNTGSYINGTWKQVASLPSGYAPLYFGSAVLPDGKVVVQGGEYNCPNGSCTAVWQSNGAIYDPVANTWTSTTAPPFSQIGDAQSVVLPNGTWMLAECCAVLLGHSSFPVYYYFNESTLAFTNEASSSDGKYDDFDEEGWTLLPNNLVLTVDTYLTNSVLTGTNSETYNSTTNTWSTAGSTINQLWDSNCGGGGGSFEVGPAVLRPDGTVFATGASDCEPGHTSIYDSHMGTWTAGPDFPNNDAANDAPAALEINGNVVVVANPYPGTFSTPASFYEWDGTNLNAFPAPPNAIYSASFYGHLLDLPNGQIMYTDFSTDVEFLTPAGTYNSAWQPTISTAPSSVAPGSTYSISGTQFNGLSQGGAYGDDFQDATNYPLVQIVNNSTGHVFYCKTHNHSTMGVATGGTTVSTKFDVPAAIETGASQLYVIANGIPSAPVSVTVALPVTTTQVTPTSLVFPTQVLGTTSAAQNISIQNTGTNQLVFSGIIVTGDYVLSSNFCNVGAQPGTHCNIYVAFRPSAIGVRNGAVTLTDNATSSPQTVTLSGMGTQAQLTPSSLVFANQVIGTTSVAKLITLKNVGTSSLSISNIAASGNFLISSKTCGTSLGAGGSCTVSITFHPVITGTQTGTVNFFDNGGGSPQTVTVSGIGTQAQLTPLSLVFGNQVVGTTSGSKLITLKNVGTTSLSISNIAVSGNFLISSKTCGTSLGAGNSCTVSIKFHPLIKGTQTGSVKFFDNGGGSPQSVSLTGTGI